jgi:hypothetical protein
MPSGIGKKHVRTEDLSTNVKFGGVLLWRCIVFGNIAPTFSVEQFILTIYFVFPSRPAYLLLCLVSLLIFTEFNFRKIHCQDLLLWLLDGVLIGWLYLLTPYTPLRNAGNYSTTANLWTLQFTTASTSVLSLLQSPLSVSWQRILTQEL